MRKSLTLGAAALLTLLVGSASGSGTQFAVGSAKSEAETAAGVEQLIFSAHSRPTEASPCAAKGSATYRTPTMQIKVDVDTLVISGPEAAFSGAVVWAQPPLPSNDVRAQFTVFDREAVTDPPEPNELPPTDAFSFDGFQTPPFERLCALTTFARQRVTQGNIVIKATGPMLLP